MRSKCCRFKGVYILSKNEYGRVRVPFGNVYSDENFYEAASIIKETWSKGKYVASVGDRVTYTLLKNRIVPDIGVIDGKEKRGEAPIIDYSCFNRVYRSRNEKGTINMDICCLIKNILRYKPVILVIEGEEDLVGFPIVLALPIGSVFLYGQPDVGAVLVYIDEEIKNKAAVLLNTLKKKT